MNFKRNKVASALAYLAGFGGALVVSGVHAQQTAQGSNPDIRVDVTGTAIRRVEGETALPVTVITRDQIDKSGATNTMELLRIVSANNSLGANNLSSNIGTASYGAQTISLRALSGGRTLVLLNGHRLDAFAGEQPAVLGTNIAAIPFAAIERVEVLKDGASALYGSDAIAGVINFITKSDYTGAEVTAQYGTPTRAGGGDQYSGSGSFGIGNLDKDKYNLFVTLSYQHQKSLDDNQRNFSNSSFNDATGLFALSSNTFPGHVTTGGIGVVNHGVPNEVRGSNGCGFSRNIVSEVYGPLGCYYDPSAAPGVESIPDDKNYNAFAKGTIQLNDNWQADLTGLYSHDASHLIIQPGPISNVFTFGPELPAQRSTITLLPSSPFYPHAEAAAAGVDGQPLNVRYRTYENGMRDTTDTNEQGQVIAAVHGSIKDWDVDASAFYGEAKTSENVNGGFQDYRLLMPLLNSGTVNLFGFNTPAVVQQLRATNFTGNALDATDKFYGGDAKISGEVFKLPAGPVSVAFGAHTQKQTREENFAEALQGGYVTGFGGTSRDVSGSRTQWATFAEVNVPIVKTLEGDAQVRYDHYSDFGGTTNPKFSLRWQPTKTLLFRSAWGTGFLAPTLYELNTPLNTAVTQSGLTDPIRCPVTHDTGVDCRTQFGLAIGGNANLKPEESEQFSAGVVIEPTPAASLSVDYFKINLKNQITDGINPAVILGDLGKYGQFVVRGPVDPNFPNLPGPIAYVNDSFINIGGIRIQGLDVDGRVKLPEYNWGRLTFEINGTYYLRWDSQNPDKTWSGNVSNEFGSAVTGVVPRWKHYATLTWDRGPWSATVAQSFQSSYTDQGGVFITGDPRTVGSMSLWDLNGTYSGFKNTKLTLGVKNLFDTNPPATNQTGSFVNGYDPSYYDARARFVYGSVSYKFK